jgi:hypothetical protein
VITVVTVPAMARMIAVRLMRARADPAAGVVSVLMVVWRLRWGVRHACCGTLTHLERRIPVARM